MRSTRGHRRPGSLGEQLDAYRTKYRSCSLRRPLAHSRQGAQMDALRRGWKRMHVLIASSPKLGESHPYRRRASRKRGSPWGTVRKRTKSLPRQHSLLARDWVISTCSLKVTWRRLHCSGVECRRAPTWPAGHAVRRAWHRTGALMSPAVLQGPLDSKTRHLLWGKGAR